MTKEAFAVMLNGREIGNEMSEADEVLALESRLFVVYGCSDDNVEIRGVDHEEIGAYGGTTFRLMETGVVKNFDGIKHDVEEMRDFFKYHDGKGQQIEAIWDDDPEAKAVWHYRTTVPHATFNIMEDGAVWCRGIVIDSKDLA